MKHQRVSYSEESDLGSDIVQYLLDHGADIMYKFRYVSSFASKVHLIGLFCGIVCRLSVICAIIMVCFLRVTSVAVDKDLFF